MLLKSLIGSSSASGSNPYRKRKRKPVFSHNRLEVLIACQVGQIKDLDILAKRSILALIPTQFSLPVNFQHNRNLQEMAMKKCLPKGLKVKPPRDFGSFPEAFSFGR